MQNGNIHVFFFVSNQVAKGLTLKMFFKLSNLQFKTANAKKFGWTLGKKFSFPNLSSLKLNFSPTVFGTT